jgi:hypothetical protein
MSPTQMTTVLQSRCAHFPRNSRGLSEEFLSPRNCERLGPRRLVGKIDLELQTADYGILSGNKSFARPASPGGPR